MSRFAIRNPYFIVVICLIISVVGVTSLARMPVDEMKIDRSFIQNLESDPEFATVVRSAIDMGHGLGLKVVAEGIETAAAADNINIVCSN